MSIEIRKISISEINDIVELFDKYMVFYKLESNPKKYKTYLKNRIDNNEATIYIAYESNTKAIGFVINYSSFSSVSL